ncbi:MAG: aminoacyl-tRNA hydrolase [Patescibacteria group bacterium]|mgnify:CR=1 FL=1
MSYIIVGLGNPGDEYLNTRHNTGRIVLEYFRKKNNFSNWESDKKLEALVSYGRMPSVKGIILVEPESFMNKSGVSIAPLVKSKKAAESLIVIHDDLDLPIGSYKISFNRGSGGHKGVESIIRAVKTEGFVRVRVGISPVTPSEKIKKPKGEKAIDDFILGNFKDKESEILKKVSKKICDALIMIISEGRQKAMSVFNTK